MTVNSGLKIFIAISLALHILGVSLLFFLPHREVKKENTLMARLVTPEEINRPDVRQERGIGSISPPQRQKSTKSSRGNRQRSEGSRVQELERLSKKGFEGQTIIKEKEEQKKGVEGTVERDSKAEGVVGSDSQTRPFIPPTPRSSTLPERIPPLPKERLFDKEVLDRLARKEKEDLKPDKGITFDTNELKYYSYMQRLKDKIEGIWRYPPDAAEKGIYGDLYIRFTIKKNGKLGNIELLRTSGYRSLDDAAMKALKDAEPFWPLPDEWKKEDLIITGHFIYSLYGVYLR